jgi:hypothetical protein
MTATKSSKYPTRPYSAAFTTTSVINPTLTLRVVFHRSWIGYECGHDVIIILSCPMATTSTRQSDGIYMYVPRGSSG